MSLAIGFEQHRAIKVHTCDWCGNCIVAGETYQRWLWIDGGDAIPAKLHLDCLAALNRERGTGYFDDEWSPGERKRGMTMDETEEARDD